MNFSIASCVFAILEIKCFKAHVLCMLSIIKLITIIKLLNSFDTFYI